MRTKSESYVNALLSEIENAQITTPISTIYIGGGTPTALPSHLLCKIIDAATRHTCKNAACDGIEITVEANPGTLSREYLSALMCHGVNRLSLGLQTTKPHLLKAINRLHSMDCFLENYHTARALGFDNINIDLMFGLPQQTIADWHDTLHEIIALAPQHISAYSLTPAENTPLWNALETGEIKLPDDDTDRNMYHMARELLSNVGYVHYELSNFAKPGFESRHNIDCWKRVPYLAFGLGAHSFDGEKRWHNTECMDEYLRDCPQLHDVCHITEAEHLSETMILGLRLTEGIAESSIPPIYTAQVTELIKKNLLTRENGFVRLTPYGMDLANQVFGEFL